MSNQSNIVCKWCGNPASWNKYLEDWGCAACRSNEVADRMPKVGDSILTTGGEKTITKQDGLLASIEFDDVTLDFFIPELEWSDSHSCWVPQ